MQLVVPAMIRIAEGGFPKDVQVMAHVPPFNPAYCNSHPVQQPGVLDLVPPATIAARKALRAKVLAARAACRRTTIERCKAVDGLVNCGFSTVKPMHMPKDGDDVATGL